MEFGSRSFESKLLHLWATVLYRYAVRGKLVLSLLKFFCLGAGGEN